MPALDCGAEVEYTQFSFELAANFACQQAGATITLSVHAPHLCRVIVPSQRYWRFGLSRPRTLLRLTIFPATRRFRCFSSRRGIA